MLEQIYRQAREVFPEECCGWLAGAPDGQGVTIVRACENVQSAGNHPIAAGRPAETAYVFKAEDLLELSPDERACEGIFLAFQYPVEIPGVSTNYFLKAALNSIRKYRGEDALDAIDFLVHVREKAKLVEIDDAMLQRAINEGFSGGEKKRSEIFQMAVLEPKLAILDETDSGLDIDALKIVAAGVNMLRHPDRATVIITHYQRLLNYIVPDFVHVLIDGRIVKSGGKELALELEDRGYVWLSGEPVSPQAVTS
ncbi:MAG: Fe-S cluster assembly ATPase SufC [Chloroflexi bacterium]|nr:Fe-S cluster assembly ATPase SufC [Chloroflexota bacterium]